MSTGERPVPVVSPADRTIGQLVADALRFYAAHFWASLLLGIPPAVVTVAVAELPRDGRIAVAVAGWPLLMTTSYVAGCFLVSGSRPDPRKVAVAFAVALIVAVPVPLLVTLVVLPAVLWLALVGLAVPVAIVEGLGVRPALARGMALGRADFVHAAGTLATLVLVVVLTQLVLFQLLHGLSDQAVLVAAFLANMVISPVLFIGSALLYEDQAARAAVQSRPQPAKEA